MPKVKGKERSFTWRVMGCGDYVFFPRGCQVLKCDYFACLCPLFSSMSHVESKNRLCLTSLHLYTLYRMSLNPRPIMLHMYVPNLGNVIFMLPYRC